MFEVECRRPIGFGLRRATSTLTISTWEIWLAPCGTFTTRPAMSLNNQCVGAHKQHQAWRNCSASFARWCLSDHESSTSPSSSGTRASAVSSGITSKSIVCVLVWVIMSVVIICWLFLVCNMALSSCVLKSDLFIRLDSASLVLVCILDMDRLVEATRQLICHLVS